MFRYTESVPSARTPEGGPVATVEEAIAEVRAGRMVVVCGEQEGRLALAAGSATSDAINFMAKEGRGLICLALTPERCDELRLDAIGAGNASASTDAFMVSIEARQGVTTGISAHDRARTIQVAIDPASTPRDLVRPGHVLPLKARPGGVLERAGETEAAVDLTRLAGLTPATVTCEVMNDDGTMASSGQLVSYCERHRLKMLAVADLVEYRRRHEKLIERVVSTPLPSAFGDFTAVGYRSVVDDTHHLALVKGQVAGRENVPVGVHSQSVTGDVFHSLRRDHDQRLDSALAMIEQEGAGVLLYLAGEGGDAGLVDGLPDDVPAELGGDGAGAQILVDLGLSSVRIITRSPTRALALKGCWQAGAEEVAIGSASYPRGRAA